MSLDSSKSSYIGAATGNMYLNPFSSWECNPLRRNRVAVVSSTALLTSAIVSIGCFSLISAPPTIIGAALIVAASLVLTESSLFNGSVVDYVYFAKKHQKAFKERLASSVQTSGEDIKKYQHGIYQSIKGLHLSQMLVELSNNRMFAVQGGNVNCIATIDHMIAEITAMQQEGLAL